MYSTPSDLAALESLTPEAAGAIAAIYGVVVVLVVLGALLFNFILFGVLTHKLAGHKGYRGYFWTGAFLGLIGLIYVVGLPDNRRRRRRAASEEDAE